jgi:hypothetical protein
MICEHEQKSTLRTVAGVTCRSWTRFDEEKSGGGAKITKEAGN